MDGDDAAPAISGMRQSIPGGIDEEAAVAIGVSQDEEEDDPHAPSRITPTVMNHVQVTPAHGSPAHGSPTQRVAPQPTYSKGRRKVAVTDNDDDDDNDDDKNAQAIDGHKPNAQSTRTPNGRRDGDAEDNDDDDDDDNSADRLPSLDTRPPTLESDGRRRSYWRRRMDAWDVHRDEDGEPVPARTGGARAPKVAPGSICTLPTEVQARFRRKVLLIFSLQLLVLTGILALLTYEPTLTKLMDDAFAEPLYILVATAVMVVLLYVLNVLHAHFPWNWLVMFAFTLAFAVFIAGIQVILQTHAGMFCVAFTFLAMGVMVGLTGIIHSAAEHRQATFLSPMTAGFVSFVVVAIGAGIVHGVIGWQFLSGAALAYALVLEFALIIWFSHDASTMFRLITPDEYMHGVIYFYTDVLIIAVFSVLFGAVILLCSAGGGGGLGYINATGCSSGCCSSCYTGEEEAGEEDEGDVGDEVESYAEDSGSAGGGGGAAAIAPRPSVTEIPGYNAAERD